MTSFARNRRSNGSAPRQNPLPTKPVKISRRKRGERCLKRRSRHAVDRTRQPSTRRRIPRHLYEVAIAKGFQLVGRGQKSSDLQLRCDTCKQHLQVRRSVLINNAPLCSHCIWIRRFDDALATGATIVTPVQGNHKLANLTLACGHDAQRQYGRLAKAAQGGHELSCETCREARYTAQAEESGWSLIGPAACNKTGYRHYQHHCGHSQDFAIVNVDNRQLDCAGCGETWASKPSKIYLFEIDLADRTVLKLGYSSDPVRRLRYQLGKAARETGKIHRVIDMESGHTALLAEKQAHLFLHRTHPNLVVASIDFKGQIKTTSEIYEMGAKDIILALMEGIKHGSSSAGGRSLHTTIQDPMSAQTSFPLDFF
jgi:hypothetical protein